MADIKFTRKHKEQKPVVAICYDFDKTLSPDDMQAQGYIQSVGYDIKNFWAESNKLAEDNDMDQNLAYMYEMMEKARGHLVFTKDKLQEYGAKVNLFPGVEEWFERIRKYGLEQDIIVEHYIISSGLKEMIEGTIVAKSGAFEKIYASSFYFDNYGVAIWPAQVVNYTNKTQFLFRIEKGVLDINDQGVNDYFPPEDIRVPFRNMIYIGDSDTDIPCMKLVNTYGGHSIGVYNPVTNDKKKVYKMIKDNRIKYFASADYTDGSELDILVKSIIDRTSSNEKLENISFELKDEVKKSDEGYIINEEEEKKESLILSLEDSSNFANTHTIISQLSEFEKWSNDQIKNLYKIGIENNQVNWILTDCDIAEFYTKLLKNYDYSDENSEKIKLELQA
jgi:hypothetical protein